MTTVRAVSLSSVNYNASVVIKYSLHHIRTSAMVARTRQCRVLSLSRHHSDCRIPKASRTDTNNRRGFGYPGLAMVSPYCAPVPTSPPATDSPQERSPK